MISKFTALSAFVGLMFLSAPAVAQDHGHENAHQNDAHNNEAHGVETDAEEAHSESHEHILCNGEV